VFYDVKHKCEPFFFTDIKTIPALMFSNRGIVIDGKGITICYPVLVIAGDFSMEMFAPGLWVAIWQRL